MNTMDEMQQVIEKGDFASLTKTQLDQTLAACIYSQPAAVVQSIIDAGADALNGIDWFSLCALCFHYDENATTVTEILKKVGRNEPFDEMRTFCQAHWPKPYSGGKCFLTKLLELDHHFGSRVNMVRLVALMF